MILCPICGTFPEYDDPWSGGCDCARMFVTHRASNFIFRPRPGVPGSMSIRYELHSGTLFTGSAHGGRVLDAEVHEDDRPGTVDAFVREAVADEVMRS